jgi:hypothetical protein
MSPDVAALVSQLLEFRDARDWKQFHTLKNLVSALSVEAAELTKREVKIRDFRIGSGPMVPAPAY